MSYRSLVLCLVVSGGVFLVAGGVASAAVVDVDYNLPWNSQNVATLTCTPAILYTETKYAYPHAWGTIPSQLSMTFDPASHGANVSGISFEYNKPGWINFEDVTLNWGNVDASWFASGIRVTTSGLKGTVYTPNAGIGAVDPDTDPSSAFSGTFLNTVHSVEVNSGVANALVKQLGVTLLNQGFDLGAQPAGGPGEGTAGPIVVSAPASPSSPVIDSAGYHVTYNYTTTLYVPLSVTKSIDSPDLGHAGDMVVTANFITDAFGFSHAFHYLPGDADLSGTVNVADLTLLLNNYNKTGMAWANGEFNSDGTVNVADLTVLLNNYNKSSPAGVQMSDFATAVPEPGTVVMLLSLALSLTGFGFWKRSR